MKIKVLVANGEMSNVILFWRKASSMTHFVRQSLEVTFYSRLWYLNLNMRTYIVALQKLFKTLIALQKIPFLSFLNSALKK